MEATFKEIIGSRIKAATLCDGNQRILIKDFSEIKCVKEGDIYLLYNPAYQRKNFYFVNEETHTDFLMFEQNLVYFDYSENLFNFHLIHDEEKLLMLDLGNQEIKKDTEMNSDHNLSNEISSNNDLITFNYFPISATHCTLVVSADQNFSQVLSNEIILDVLQIFSIAANQSLKVGYDSLGAGCLINHLNFELLFMDDLQDLVELPIERLETTKVLSTCFKYLKEDEISIFDDSTTVEISCCNQLTRCWKLKSIVGDSENVTGFQNYIAHLTNIILTKLIELKYPHNLIITENGTTVYVIPRHLEDNDLEISSSSFDLAGLVRVKNEDFNSEKVSQLLADKIFLNEEEFSNLNMEVVQMISSIYEVN